MRGMRHGLVGKIAVLGFSPVSGQSQPCLLYTSYPDLFLGLTSNDYVTYTSALETYLKESGIKLITGDWALEAAWANYVSTYLSMGGEAVRTSLLEAYNAANGTALEFA